MSERTFAKRLPDIYSSISYNKGLCPVAEEVQKRLMVFKTNYRDLSLARQKARILKETIEHFNRENLKNQDADSWDNCMWG